MLFFSFVFHIFFSFAAECFTRIYKETMILPSRVFRTSETSSIRVCKELCMVEGSRCQSFALGISSIGGGNGTCQLSSERIFEHASTGRKPRGTIYDPDFNLYQRKESCRIQDNNEMPPKEEGKYFFLCVFVHLFASYRLNGSR